MSRTSEGRYPGPVLRTASDYGWRLLVIGAVVYFGVRLLSHLSVAVIPLVVGLLLTALLRPLFAWQRRRGVPRGPATALTIVVALLVIAGVATLVIVKAADEAPQLGNQINRLIPHVERWLETGPLHVDARTVNNFSNTLSSQVTKNTSAIASTVLSTGKTLVDLVTGLLLALFITIFLLYDGEGIWEFMVKAVPRAGRERADRAGRAAWTTVGHYVRGTLVVAAFHGVVIAVTLTILGVPLVAPLAVLVALGSLVPLVGAVVTGALAVGVASLEQGLAAGIVVVVVLLVDNQIEAHVLQPFVVGRYVKVHPLATVLALAVGAILFGIFGAIVALPTVACINAAVRALIEAPAPERAMDPERVEEGGLRLAEPRPAAAPDGVGEGDGGGGRR